MCCSAFRGRQDVLTLLSDGLLAVQLYCMQHLKLWSCCVCVVKACVSQWGVLPYLTLKCLAKARIQIRQQTHMQSSSSYSLTPS